MQKTCCFIAVGKAHSSDTPKTAKKNLWPRGPWIYTVIRLCIIYPWPLTGWKKYFCCFACVTLMWAYTHCYKMASFFAFIICFQQKSHAIFWDSDMYSRITYAGVLSVKQTERDDIAEVVFVDDPCWNEVWNTTLCGRLCRTGVSLWLVLWDCQRQTFLWQVQKNSQRSVSDHWLDISANFILLMLHWSVGNFYRLKAYIVLTFWAEKSICPV